MNWYKFKKSQVMTVDTPTGIDVPVDNDDEGDGEDWHDCYKQVMQWVKANIQSEPLASIQRDMVSNIALHHFQEGIYPEVMLWHEDKDFFSNPNYRAASVYLKFAGYDSNPQDDEVYSYFDLNTMKQNWMGLIRQSSLLPHLQGSGCSIRFIDEDLYDFILGEICNNLCYRNKDVAYTFQQYLENNMEKMESDALQQMSMGELSRYVTPQEIMQFSFGDELDVTNGDFKCYPSDYRFDSIGIRFEAQMTVSIDIPYEIEERFSQEDEEFD